MTTTSRLACAALTGALALVHWSAHAQSAAPVATAPAATMAASGPLAAAPATSGAAPQAALLASQVAGTWREQTGGQGLVVFAPEGSFKLLLRKGEMGDFRSVDGVWRVTEPSQIKIGIVVDGKTVTSRTLKLVFRESEMIFVDDDGRETRHRRHEGALPSEYVW